jgi:hypothetical protein
MNPVLRAEDIAARLGSTAPGVPRHAIYADSVEIARVTGIPGSVTLVFRGNLER